MLELERPDGLYSRATKSLKTASLDYQLDARWSRVSHLLQSLDELTEKWNPKLVALCQPSGISWPVPALDLLLTSLAEWSAGRDLPQFSYTAQEVRTAIAGHPNASRDQLGYATMLLLGLIGQGRSTHEWEAIAVGHYHLTRGKQAEVA
jgi:Holliday junction resolvasome RuvABC endonuclease subunit